MKKYTVIVENGTFESNSRNSKKHLQDNGGDECQVYYKDKLVSWAKKDESGKIYNCLIVD